MKRRGPRAVQLFWVAGPLLAVGMFSVLSPPTVAGVEPPVEVIDLHVDLSYQVNFKGKPFASGTGQYDQRWLRASGVRGVVLPLYVPRDASAQGPRMQHLEGSHARMQASLGGSTEYGLDLCSPPPLRAGVQFAFEGAEPVGWELDSVTRWRARGVRLFGLVHAYDNALASSSGGAPGRRAYGLSRRGAELTRRVHVSGGMIDVSHASDEAFADVVNQASAGGRPVVATHSNARALAPHPRNLTDSQLRAIAATGGVVGINFHSPYLLGGRGVATLDDVVRHIQHALRVAGKHHVAIGSDFEGGIAPPEALRDIRGFPRLAAALRAAGLGRDTIAAVFHGNARRVLCAHPRSVSDP